MNATDEAAPRFDVITGREDEVLRLYGPGACDPVTGRPLDWRECRPCGATGRFQPARGEPTVICDTCHGHRSLRRAVLVALYHLNRDALKLMPGDPLRCEDCRHPLGADVWEDDGHGDDRYSAEDRHAYALQRLLDGCEPDPGTAHIHYSACDERCEHDCMAVRASGQWPICPSPTDTAGAFVREHADTMTLTASCRHVDVRVGVQAVELAGFDPLNMLLVRYFDLRRENVAVLCARCWTGRTIGERIAAGSGRPARR